MLRFSVSLLVLASVLLAATYAGVYWQWFASTPSYTLEIIFLLGVSTLIIYYLLFRRSAEPSFTQDYLLSIVVKMLGYGTLMLVIIFTDRSGAFGNAALFMVCYLLFTALEVGFLFSRINRPAPPKSGPKRI